ncbi:hypothetical protein KY320_01380 [Candidatus Woesearchaeota archaeon]|nr:hypothetical protein [Candidatus Woesearchaeota archaeon]
MANNFSKDEWDKLDKEFQYKIFSVLWEISHYYLEMINTIDAFEKNAEKEYKKILQEFEKS